MLIALSTLCSCSDTPKNSNITLNFSELAGDTIQHYPAIDLFVIHHKNSEGLNWLAGKVKELRDSNYYYISTVDRKLYENLEVHFGKRLYNWLHLDMENLIVRESIRQEIEHLIRQIVSKSEEIENGFDESRRVQLRNDQLYAVIVMSTLDRYHKRYDDIVGEKFKTSIYPLPMPAWLYDRHYQKYVRYYECTQEAVVEVLEFDYFYFLVREPYGHIGYIPREFLNMDEL